DGRFVVFNSFSNDLVNGDNNGALDVFVRDTTSNITTLVSAIANEVNSGRGASFEPVISGNGTYIVFNSRATDLVPRDLNGNTDVFGLNLETTVSVSLDRQTIAEGSSDTVQYRIRRNRTVGELTVRLAIDPSSTATIGSDYLIPAGSDITQNGSEITIRFADGVEEAILILTPINDTNIEDEETVNLSLVATPDYAVSESFGTTSLRIIDNDIPILISVSNTTTDNSEGNADEKEFTFQIRLDSTPFTAPVTVRYTTQAGTADANDFTATSGELTFDIGEDTKTVTVRVKGDTQFEDDESFSFILSNPSANARINTEGRTAIATITNDDNAPTVTISGATSITEGNADSQDYTFTVSLSEASSAEVTIDYAIRDLTSTGDVDYVAVPSGKLTFAPGQTTQTIVVSVRGDRLFEVDEQFEIELLNPVNAILRDDQKLITGTITDNDTAPSITIEAPSEQSEGTTPYTFTVRLSEASGRPVSVAYETVAGTALAGEDFAANSGTITFAPGETSKTIEIAIADNTVRERNESFSVRLSNPIDATITTDIATATITDNDSIPTVSITNVSQAEGNSGNTAFQFEVTLSNASDQEIVLNYSTKDGTATLADNDYEGVTAGTIRFAPGTTSQTFTVNGRGDTKRERDETFSVELTTTTPELVTIPTTAIGVGTIQTDDSAFPILSVSPATVQEGGILVFTVSLSEVSDEVITVDVATSNGTATTGDSDYTAIATRTLTFNPNTLTQTIEVQTTADNKREPDETITLTLSNPVNGTIAETATAIGTIENDDQRPTVSISSPSLSEDDPLAANYPFTIRLSNPTTETVTVRYRTVDDSALTSDNDYAATGGTVTFNPGEVEKTIAVRVNADRKFEPTERFIVRLEDSVNASISPSATDAFGVLTNDDAEPELTIRSVSRSEGNSGKTPLQFVVSLNNPSSQEIQVNYATANDSAISGSDYDATSGTLIFAPGEEEKIITVNANGDTGFEPDESFFVRLSNPINVKLANTEVRGTIINDDDVIVPSIQIDEVVAPEGSTDQTYTFKVRLSQATTNTVTVQYRTDNGSATTSDGDYVGITTPQTLTFNPGEIEKEISIAVRGDTKFEQNEFFFVDLLSPTNATLSTLNRGRGAINNDDARPTISIGTVAVSEGNDNFVNATFTVSLSNPSDQTIEVNYATVDGTAQVSDNDYDSASGTLRFLPGTTSQQITVRIRGDRKFEPDEFFTIRLSSPVNADLFTAPNQGVGTIQSDDFRPTISIDDTTLLPAVEGNSGTTPARFTVRLSNPSNEAVTVRYVTRNITANDSDFTAVTTPTLLTFAPGQTEQFIDLEIIGDTRFEPDETFSIELSDPTNAQISTGRTVATIRNDDPVPQVSIAAVPTSKSEGNDGITSFTFEVSLSDASYVPITVNYTTVDGTATTANKDYLQATETLTFAPGETKKTITINVLGDTEFEGNETFQIRLSNPNNATLQSTLATATILEDDTPDNTDDSDSLYDILWRNRRTGENMLWMPSGTFLDREIPLLSELDPMWTIAGTADFDNDGAMDLFWRNRQTGENRIWRTNADLTFTQITLASVSNDWEMVGIGDFNGDRSPDLFWRNSLNGGNVSWLLRGGIPFFGAEMAPVTQPGWQVKTIADFDNDGKSDLFWSNQNNGATALWLMEGAAPRTGRLVNQVADVMWQPVSAGDFNRDGFVDLLWRHGRSGESVIWLMREGWAIGSVTLPTVPDTNWTIEQVFDFNADQNLDILWRQNVSQETVIWFLNREQMGTAAILPTLPDRNWQIEGAGKFGNPSKGEILLRNYQTGENRIWRIHRDLFNRTFEMESQSIDWELQGTADFDRNGSADILWRNLRTRELSIWLTENGRVLNKVAVPASVVVSNAWQIMSLADFSGDGNPDILWRNQSSGGLSMWLFNGTQVVDGFELPSPDIGWRIEGVADFNGDRNPDILWRHSVSGELSFWLFDRTQVRLGVLSPAIPTNWSIKDFGDFNRDGRMDLVWRNDGSNETTIWMMDGAKIINGVVFSGSQPSWDIVGVGDFNLDNQTDLIWRDRVNGTNTVWYLVNGRLALSNFIPAIRDIDWQVKDINDF
ncbi:VCBS repeat-containing protein, partial [Pseudanabaenaceae cyanobacterium LEGE 13415]|nr:VCBS repeat-containing protein [Pseudanabaenaceae cyanobacterium LEGE 13415]